MDVKTQIKPGAIILEGHVQGLANVRALGEAGIPTIVVDKATCVAGKSKYCKAFYKSPDFLSTAFIDFLIELSQKENLKGWVLIPSNDHIVINISKNRKRLEKYYKIITPEENIIQNIYNKQRLLDIASSIGLPIPKTYYPKDDSLPNFDLSFPVIVKGKQGLTFYKTFGRKVFQLENLQELKDSLRKIKNKYALEDIFIQELIPLQKSNKTVSYTAFTVNGEIKSDWTGVKLREHPIKFGTATYCESIICQKCSEYSEELLKALNYTGVCEVEYLLDPRDNKYKLIEINARTWLWVGLAKSSGINYPKMIFNHVNNIPQEFPSSYKVGQKWMHIYTDIIFSFIGVTKGHYSLGKYLKSVFSKKSYAVFSLKDFKPFVFLSFSLIKMFRNR